MVEKEKRKHTRVDNVNLLNYVYFNEESKEESQGMGRTLNVSEAGLLLETSSSLDIKREVSMNIGLEEEILSINGTVVFSNSSKTGLSKSGIQFTSIGKDELDILKNHLQAYQPRG